MSNFAAQRILTIPSINRLMEHLRSPLYRNGYALVFSSAATSALGLLYWMFAARFYTAEVIGVNSALISTMMFLANVAQLGFMNALNRFLPTAGRASGRFVVALYSISLGAALVVSIGFVMGLQIWAPTLDFLRTDLRYFALFTLGTMGWCIFVLQDSALVGLRRATWVPIENLFFSIAKIVLLVVFMAAMPRFGVFASWVIPTLLTLGPVNWLIFRYLIPQNAVATTAKTDEINTRSITHYVSGDYFTSLIWVATSNLLPVIIIERVGAEASAYFFMAWTIAYSFYMVSKQMGMSLIAEAASDQEKLTLFAQRTMLQTTRLLVPMVAVVWVCAPYLLRIFGKEYADEASNLLRLLSLSALPFMVTSLYISIVRVQRRMGALVITHLCLYGLVLLLTHFFLDAMGVIGVGVAWVVAQSVVALVMLCTTLRAIITEPWLARLPRPWWKPVVSGWRTVKSWPHRRRLHHIAAELFPATPGAEDWRVQRVLTASNDVLVALVGAKGQAPAAVLKVAQTTAGAIGLATHRTAIETLWADARLTDWQQSMPMLLASGPKYVLERLMPGVNPTALLSDDAQRRLLSTAAIAKISTLHQATAETVVIDSRLLHSWVDEPLMHLRQALAGRTQSALDAEMERIRHELHTTLTGRTVAVSWVHGDYTWGNILTTPDGSMVTGVIDWELAAEDELPMLDVVLLILTTRMAVTDQELGAVVAQMLSEDQWSQQEQATIAKAASALPGEALPLSTLVLLCWLRHIAANLRKSIRYRGHWLWRKRNIDTVLNKL